MAYFDRGWSPLPLPAGEKGNPPTEFTGHYEPNPTRADVGGWIAEQPAGNIGLRFADDMVGIDVDHYDGKRGADTLAAMEAELGPLPATWISTSRDLPSGIRYYRVPAGESWRDDMSDIDVLQRRHRYAVAPPSVHPSGRVYRWVRPDGSDAEPGELPNVADMPDLPPAWVERLRKAPPVPVKKPSPELTTPGNNGPADRLMAAVRAGDLTWPMLLDEGWQEIGSDHEGRTYLLRPDYGSPPTSNYSGNVDSGLLMVHSGAVPWWRYDKPITPLRALAASCFGGDQSAATKALIGSAHGSPVAPFDRWPGDVLAKVAGVAVADEGECEAPARRRLALTPASAIKPRPTRWLWRNRIALGALSLIAGMEGTGKSTLAYTLAAMVTRGTLQGDRYGQPRAVLIVATEDSWEHTIVPRLMAANADLDRVYRVEAVTALGTYGTVSLPHDNDDLEAAIEQTGAGLILLDPLMSRISGDIDTHRDAEVRLALEPITDIADRHKVAVVGLIHFNKAASSDVLNNVMASKAFTAVARSVSMVARDADDDTGNARVFATPKNNLAADDLPLLKFTITGHVIPTDEGPAHTSRLVWGDEVAGDIAEHIAPAVDSDTRSQAAEAREWLTEYMRVEGGRVQARDAIKAWMKATGDNYANGRKRLSTARRKLGYATESRGFPAVYYWIDRSAHSGDTPPGESSQLSPLSHQGDAGHSGDSWDSREVTPRDGSQLCANCQQATATVTITDTGGGAGQELCAACATCPECDKAIGATDDCVTCAAAGLLAVRSEGRWQR